MTTDTEKAPDAFRTITEVSRWLDTPAHVLRFWESRFPEVAPVKRAGGRRYYRPEDMQLLGGIKTMLHDRGQSIRDVQEVFAEEGIDGIVALCPDFDFSAPPDPEDGPPVHRFTLSVGSEDAAPMMRFDAPESVAAEPEPELPTAPIPEVPDAPEIEIPDETPPDPEAPEIEIPQTDLSDVEAPSEAWTEDTVAAELDEAEVAIEDSGPEQDFDLAVEDETDTLALATDADTPADAPPQTDFSWDQSALGSSDGDTTAPPSAFRSRRTLSDTADATDTKPRHRERDSGQIRGFFFTDLGEPGLDETDDSPNESEDDEATFASFAALQDAAEDAMQSMDDETLEFDDTSEVVDLAEAADEWSDLPAAPVDVVEDTDTVGEVEAHPDEDPAPVVVPAQRSLLPKDPPHVDPDRPSVPGLTAELRALTSTEIRSIIGPDIDDLGARLTALRDRMTAA